MIYHAPFLDFYGLESLDDILGKTDEDMHWHVDNEPYMNDELEVIKKGARITDAPGKCIVKGAVHEILCNKIPMYEGDKITGLIGYFENSDEKLARIQRIEHSAKIDRVTGLMNAHAFVDSMIDFAGRFHEKGDEYGLIILNNIRHQRILDSYGEEFADKVLKAIGEKLLSVAGMTCAVSRPKDSIFAVISKIDSPDEIYELGDKIKAALKEINEVDGTSVTIRIKLAAKARSETTISDEGIYEWGLKEVTKESPDHG